MENLFIPYDLALELKELGFDTDCLSYYISTSYYNSKKELKYRKAILYHGHFNRNSLSYFDNNKSIQALAPLYQQAFEWFRKNFGIYARIDLIKSSGYGLNEAFYYNIKIPINQMHFGEITNIHDSKKELFQDWIDKKANKTYEESELECLKQLIKIVKDEK